MNIILNLSKSIINTYSTILFSDKYIVGLLILLSTLVEPRTGITGILGTIIALVVARLLNFEDWNSKSGLLAFNSMLVSLGVGFYMPNQLIGSLEYWLALVSGSLIALLLFIALNYLTTTYLRMPSMSLSFSVVAILLSFFMMRVGQFLVSQEREAIINIIPTSSNMINFYLKSLGSIFFQPYILAGILVLIALILTSRIGFILTMMGFYLSYFLVNRFNLTDFQDIGLYQISYTSFNLMLIAMSIGGVFLIPSLRSYLIAIFACFLGFITSYAMQFLFENYYVAPYAFPMNLTVIFIIIALRMRLQNKNPYIADFGVMLPEENLKFYFSRIKRFYDGGGPQFYLPFTGEWTITQGNHGEITHKEQWAYAWDFEIKDKEGYQAKNDGKVVTDYFCYNKPVLSSAGGWVVNLADGIADNPVGQINTRERWGNFIVLNHGYGLYSMYCHLKKGSIKFKNGEWVAKGAKLGVVGNSGRSAVPHLHFNIQYGAEPGSVTVKSFLINFKKKADDYMFKAYDIPKKDDIVSPLFPVNYLQDVLHLKVDDEAVYEVEAYGKKFTEKWKVDVNLYGSFFIKSDRNASLEFSVYDGIFNVLNFTGNKKSALHGLALSLCRLPLYKDEELNWNDYPPYSILANPTLESTLLFLQSIFKFSKLEYKAKSTPTKDNVTTSFKNNFSVLNKSISSYSGKITLKELTGFTDIEILNKDNKTVIKANLRMD